MNRYLVRVGSLCCGLALIAMSSLISQSPGVPALIVSVFLFSFGLVTSVTVLILTAFDLGGPA